MTLCVTIGKLTGKEPIEMTIILTDYNNMGVQPCAPVHFDVCNPDMTIYPRESIRDGSTGFWDFWHKYADEIYHEMRKHPHSNDIDVVALAPYAKNIKALLYPLDRLDLDRMTWLKFWAARAVHLYGDKAGAMFS